MTTTLKKDLEKLLEEKRKNEEELNKETSLLEKEVKELNEKKNSDKKEIDKKYSKKLQLLKSKKDPSIKRTKNTIKKIQDDITSLIGKVAISFANGEITKEDYDEMIENFREK